MESFTRGWRGLCCLAMLACVPDAAACEGRVLALDAPAHAATGVSGARVSDGRRVATTGDDGRFVLRDLDADARLFVVAPDGWRVPQADNGLPATWRSGCGGFALLRAEPARGPESRVLVFSDPQTANATEVDYYARGTVAAAAREPGIAFGITLGDITNDVMDLYPALNRATTSLGVPWLHVPGNHDIDPDATDDATALSTFHRVYGPDTHAWQSPRAVVVVLDNVVSMPGQRPAYVAGLREDQFEFLAAFLPLAPRDRLLVVAAHMPWFDTAPEGAEATVRSADRERLFALLQPFPHVLLLTGHNHAQRQVFHDADTDWHGVRPLHEYNVGAVAGSYWSGVPDADGIPASTMSDGTPKGYAVLTLRDGGEYALAWRPVGFPPGDPALAPAMALHAPKVLRQGAYPAWGVFANVFLGHDGTRVEYRIDGGEWTAMAKVDLPDPRLTAENARDDGADALRSRDRSPEPEISPHLWRGVIDTRRAAGEHRIEVRAFDDDGTEHRAAIGYRLDPWRP